MCTDFGNYNQRGHCNQSNYNANLGCAAEGEAFLDLCGNRRGGISQVLFTDPGSTYTLTFMYESHAGCNANGATTEMYVALTSASSTVLKNFSVTHINTGSWALNWSSTSATFVATTPQTTLSFTSVTSGCGCMLIDDVNVKKDCLVSPPPPPPCGNSILGNGDFETGWTAPYVGGTLRDDDDDYDACGRFTRFCTIWYPA